MVRFLLLLALCIVIARIFWRVVDNIIEAASGQPPGSRRSGGPSGVPQRGVHMERDPVCGTFVLPDRAISLVDGRTTTYFCSEACRDKYRARTA